MGQMNLIVVAGDVKYRRVQLGHDCQKFTVARKIGLAIFIVFDHVAQVHHQIGSFHLVHAFHELPRESRSFVTQLAQLAVEERLGSEVLVGDQRESHVVPGRC